MPWTPRHLAPVLAALAAGALLLGAAPSASAQQTAADDAAGDTDQPGLDVTQIELRNAEAAVRSRISFVEDRRGRVVLIVDPRRAGAQKVAVISRHRPQGLDTTRVIRRDGETVACPRAAIVYDASDDTGSARLPSSCLAGGDYGSVRVRVLTEDLDFADVDLAPSTTTPGGADHWTWTDWAARG